MVVTHEHVHHYQFGHIDYRASMYLSLMHVLQASCSSCSLIVVILFVAVNR